MKKKMFVVAILVTVLSLFAAACGDDGGGGASADASSPFVQAIVDDIIDSGDAVSEDRGEVECYVAGIVGRVGEERLRDLGVSETNVADLDEIGLSDEETGQVVDALFDCIDTQALMAESFAEDFESDEAECLASKFDEDTLRGFFESTFSNDEPPSDMFAQMFTFMADCGISLDG